MFAAASKKTGFLRSKKQRVCAFSAVFIMGVGLFSSSEIRASYNDYRYEEYENMDQSYKGHARYVVPNLYRQDASYSNVKTFPLVVSNETEYVPLDVFAQYSYLEVVYGKNSYSFYINNTNNGHYIVFDLAGKTATSFDGDLENVSAKLYYQTYYVPAEDVCEALNLVFESYDDPEDGIRAARISDSGAKYSLDELVEMYSPVKKENTDASTEESQDSSSETAKTEPSDDETSKDKPKLDPGQLLFPDKKSDEASDKKSDEEASEKDKNETDEKEDDADEEDDSKKTEEIPDPYESVAARELYLSFENQPNAHTKALLDTLKNAQVKAVFFVEKERILEYPELVRRMITDGHTVGLYVSVTDENTALSNDRIGERLSETQDALRLVTKSETRLARLAAGSHDVLRENDFAAYAEEHGYRLYDATLRASEKGNAAEELFETLAEQPRVKRTEHIGFSGFSSTEGTVSRLIDFCKKYKQFHLASPDENASLPSLLAE